MKRAFALAALVAALCAATPRETPTSLGAAALAAPPRTVRVAGSAVDLLNTALVHSTVTTPTGMIRRSTETIELKGDLIGRVLYHVTSVLDFAEGTLVNTGNQVFSGVIAGSEPVMLHDDRFRFDVNFATGAETGRVYLYDHIAGPKVRCLLQVTGSGLDGDRNPTSTYSGECTFWGR